MQYAAVAPGTSPAPPDVKGKGKMSLEQMMSLQAAPVTFNPNVNVGPAVSIASPSAANVFTGAFKV